MSGNLLVVGLGLVPINPLVYGHRAVLGTKKTSLYIVAREVGPFSSKAFVVPQLFSKLRVIPNRVLHCIAARRVRLVSEFAVWLGWTSTL